MAHGIPPSVKSVYLLPIGGTLAAPLAGLLKERGFRVEGSDLALYSPMKELIAEMGIVPRPGYHASNITPDLDLVLIGNAVPRTNAEVVAVLESGRPYASMPEALRELVFRDRTPLVVAGTHGKTTTTSLCAYLLDRAGLDPGFLVGGVPIDFGRSYRLGSGAPFVVEGDEYNTAFFDRGAKFLHYAPRVALITHLEFDHGDIYPDLAAIEAEFGKLVRLVPAGGHVIVCADAPRALAVAQAARPDAITYGIEASARYRAVDLRDTASGTAFRLEVHGRPAGDVELPLFGRHNVENALGALAAGVALGAPLEKTIPALRTFSGVKRRLEERGRPRGVIVVDDFAHHPTAVRETIHAARARYGRATIHVLFEPRSLTAGRSLFLEDYRRAFALADRVSFAPTFHAGRLREEDRLDFPALASDLQSRGLKAKAFATLDLLVEDAVAIARSGDVLLFMSSGSFGGALDRALAALSGKAAAAGTC